MLTSAQLVNLACQTAKVPGWTQLAGQKLNLILQELSQAYDIATNRQTFNFTFNSGTGTQSGPYTLPANWLRANRDDVFYVILGVTYRMTPISLAEYDALVQQAGLSEYPAKYAVDNSALASQGSPVMYVWPPPSGSFPVTARYFAQMPDILMPETSAVIPWFPSQVYLERRLSGEMMLLSNDDRAVVFLGGRDENGFEGAAALLDRYLKSEGDSQVVKTVTLDRRLFGPSFDRAKNTKTIGF